MKVVMNALERAQAYIKENACNINTTYRHQFHLMPPVGWMNDPNGFCFYQGEYHLFYQFYPYASVWGPMHWGHAKSKDLLLWENLQVALAPGEAYDKNGVFSGTAVVIGDELRLYYTGVVDTNIESTYDEALFKLQNSESKISQARYDILKDHVVRQVQCMAVSMDGLHFDKYTGNPVIDSNAIPVDGRVEDFRDPKVWQYNDIFYMAIGSKRTDFIGQILFYVSDDGNNWRYLNQLTLGKDFGTVWECPDIFELNGKHVLMISPQDKPRKGIQFENVHTAIALIGNFDYVTGQFTIEKTQELDGGFDFYAPQTVTDENGNRVMIAWMNMWERRYVLDAKNHGWNGSMTLPRVLSLVDNHIYQWPVDTINNYREQCVSLSKVPVDMTFENPALFGNVMDMELCFEIKEGRTFEMVFFVNETEGISLQFDKYNNIVMMDRMNTKLPIESFDTKNDYTRSLHLDLSGEIHVRVILDVSSIEVFFEKGRYTMTSLFFPGDEGNGVCFKADGQTLIKDLTKWDLTSH